MEENKVQSVKNNYTKQFDNLNYGKILFGIILVALGLFYLLQKLGIISNEITLNLWRFWPLILVFIGLSILSLKRNFISLIIASLVLILILFIFFQASIGSLISGKYTNDQKKVENITAINIGKESGVAGAKVEVDFGGGKLNLTGGGTQAVSGSLDSSVSALTTAMIFQNGFQTIKIKTDASDFAWNKNLVNSLNLILADDLPYELFVNFGAGEISLDLSSLIISHLEINTGASDLDLKMGNKSDSRIKIKAGASSVKLAVPTDVGIKLKLTSGLASQELAGLIDKGDGWYEDGDYGAKEKKIEIEADISLADLKITRY